MKKELYEMKQRNFYKVYYQILVKCENNTLIKDYSLKIRATCIDEAKRIIEEFAMDNYYCDSVNVYCVDFIRKGRV